MEIKNFFVNSDIKAKTVAPGVTRKVLSFNDKLMVCELTFEVGAVGALHEHFHDQCSYIVSGKMEFQIGDEKMVLGAGDTTYKQPHIVHGGVCLEKAVVLDIFTPMREDFLCELEG